MVLGYAGVGFDIEAPSAPNSGDHVRDMILDEYLSPTLWDLPTSNEQIQIGKVLENAPIDEKQTLSAQKLNDNILTVSLLVEGMGSVADQMGTVKPIDEYLY